jgi:hypothetical protein
LQPGFSQAKYSSLVQAANLPYEVRCILRDQTIVLMNRYWRHYYASRDGRFRLTLDSALTYCRIDRLYNSFTHQQVNHTCLVVELKYDPLYEPQANRVASVLPFRVTRNSKYTQGIERVYF